MRCLLIIKNYNESNLVSDEKKTEDIKQAFIKSCNEQTAVEMVITLSEKLEKLRIKKSKLSGSYKLVEKVKEMKKREDAKKQMKKEKMAEKLR